MGRMAKSKGPKIYPISWKIQQQAVSPEQKIFCPLGVLMTKPPHKRVFFQKGPLLDQWHTGTKVIQNSCPLIRIFFAQVQSNSQILQFSGKTSFESSPAKKIGEKDSWRALRECLSRWSQWSWLTKTPWMLGRLPIQQAGGRYRLGPIHWKGEERQEKTGSIMILACAPMEITAVEWPIHVQVMVLSADENLGVLTGSSLSSSASSVGMFLRSCLMKKQKNAQNLEQKEMDYISSMRGKRGLKEPLPQQDYSRSAGQQQEFLSDLGAAGSCSVLISIIYLTNYIFSDRQKALSFEQSIQ